jgi:hypothetical protein
MKKRHVYLVASAVNLVGMGMMMRQAPRWD